MRRIGLLLVSASLVLAVSIGCVSSAAAGRVYVRVSPPAPIVEVRAAMPGVGFVWIDGYHRWEANHFTWVPGRWDRPPRLHARWVPGQWHDSRRGWYFVAGHWR
jgi:hypothetical protein